MSYRLAKRGFDVIVAAAAAVVTAPLMLVIAIAIRLEDRGPALLRQSRVGLDGQDFDLIKFRTMVPDAHALGTGWLIAEHDPRITRVGKVLRKWSLDELPQVFNVLFGDMSVVGPRPHAVAHNEQYKTQILEYMLRHKVKPGITGWAQVNGWRGETDTLEKMIERVAHDLHYISNYSFLLDLKIIFLTAFGRKVSMNAH